MTKLVPALTVTAAVLAGGLAYERTAGAETAPSVLRAQMLELVDANGTTRATLKVEPEGAVVFRLMDEDGTIRVKLGAGRDGSGLLLANEKTEPGVHLLATRTKTWVALQRDARRRVIRP
jgi:hypothetical protein